MANKIKTSVLLAGIAALSILPIKGFSQNKGSDKDDKSPTKTEISIDNDTPVKWDTLTITPKTLNVNGIVILDGLTEIENVTDSLDIWLPNVVKKNNLTAFLYKRMADYGHIKDGVADKYANRIYIGIALVSQDGMSATFMGKDWANDWAVYTTRNPKANFFLLFKDYKDGVELVNAVYRLVANQKTIKILQDGTQRP